MDSGCWRHMIGDESKFSFLTKKKSDNVTFRDNAKGKIIEYWNVSIITPFIENVLPLDGLKHDLLSISQLCVLKLFLKHLIAS